MGSRSATCVAAGLLSGQTAPSFTQVVRSSITWAGSFPLGGILVSPLWVSAAGQRVGNLDGLVDTTVRQAGDQASSDAHAAEALGFCYTEFAGTVRDAPDLVAAIRSRRAAAHERKSAEALV